MVQINFAQKTVNVKIVYYGPGMSGKTTNLEVVHQRAPDRNRGELTSISTDGDRTLFFDYMPLDLGTVAGMRTCFQVYTVPGQVYYNSTRKLVLQGVDGVIFVADSGSSMLDQNLESLRNLEENLNEYGKSLATMPHVVQWNKRDLPDAMAVEELEKHLNNYGAQTFEAVANSGQGVFPTLKGLAATVLRTIMQETSGAGASGAASKPTPVTTQPAAPFGGADPAPSTGDPLASPFGAGQPPTPEPQAVPPPAGFQQPAAALDTSAPSAGAQAAPATTAAGLDVQAKPQNAPTAPQASPGQLMKAAAGVSHAPQRTTNRAHSVPTTSRPQTSSKTVAAPKKKGKGFFTGAFVVLAAGAGAALAWVVLTVL